MKSSQDIQLSPVALQILAYLNMHREAQDTVEGIAEWWLLEQRIRRVTKEVKKALVELVACGLVLERDGHDGHVHYCLNPETRWINTRHLREVSPD